MVPTIKDATDRLRFLNALRRIRLGMAAIVNDPLLHTPYELYNQSSLTGRQDSLTGLFLNVEENRTRKSNKKSQQNL